MTVEELATEDINDELMKESKSFLAFKHELDPVMQELTDSYIKLQEGVKNEESKTNL